MKCEDCTEHSGIEQRLNAGDKVMERFEKFMDHQTKRSEHIFIGIIFILITSLLSIFLTLSPPRDINKQAMASESQIMEKR